MATIVALPIGRGALRNDAEYIFGHIDNLTTWPAGWTFMLAFLSAIWSVGGFDSCVHLAEEAANATQVNFGVISFIPSADRGTCE